MHKSSIEHDFDDIRQYCDLECGIEDERKLCDAMHCVCAKSIIAEWTSSVFNDHFRGDSSYFCTLYLERDAFLWSGIGSLRIRNIKNRLKRFLRKAGLDKVVLIGVLDAILIAKTGFQGNPEPQWHFHWHFFLKERDLTPEKIKLLRTLLKDSNAGRRPFMAKLVKTEGFYTSYLWKPSNKMRRRLMRPSGVFCNYYTGYAKGRYLGAMETFMIANPGLSWLYIQGLRRSSGRLIPQ